VRELRGIPTRCDARYNCHDTVKGAERDISREHFFYMGRQDQHPGSRGGGGAGERLKLKEILPSTRKVIRGGA